MSNGWRILGRQPARLVLSCTLLLVLHARGADAQLARLAAPGPLARAHASLAGSCDKCHESGKGISAERCLACHKPIAERVAAHKGVHRTATNGCVSCHREHAGADADMRHLDKARFNHATETGFALEGRHAPLARRCESCHKTRSFLKAQTACASCHTDVHKPTLGPRCDTCHSLAVSFRDTGTRFDHTKAAFQLEGRHRSVECAKCHVNRVYRGLKSASCTDCHKDQHNRRFASACTSCHTVEGWKTQKVDHAKTTFALKGRHTELRCDQCHKQSAVRVKLVADRCTACHADPHRGEFRQECTSCHTEQGWRQVKLDHKAKTKTGFELTGKHAEAACAACHKSVKLVTAGRSPGNSQAGNTPAGNNPANAGSHVRRAASGAGKGASEADFRGLSTACVSCHADVHRAELGTRCDTCHTTATFRIAAFKHDRAPEFFGGQHATVACAKCHAPQLSPVAPPRTRTDAPLDGWKFKSLSTTCASCHRDVHLGQLGSQCETCHSIAAAKFAATGFSHARGKYVLSGRHQDARCDQCHKSEAGTFPAGRGTAVRFKGLPTTCQGCHQDKHLGQLGKACDTCHTPASFKLPAYKHVEKDKPGFFVAKHAAARCQDCHKEEEGQFPAGRGAAIRYKGFGTACATCHADRDKHQGSLGTRCGTCHEPSRWAVTSRAFHKNGVFPLDGRHLSVECASCHVNGVTRGTPTRCVECHWVRRQDDRYRTRLGTDCEKCHRTMSWVAVNWNHESQTGMRLSPVHRALGCESCHQGQQFSSPGLACDSCHRQDYLRASSPNHAAAGFPTNCDVCHRAYQSSWQQVVFNHNSSFALVGMHAGQPCASCHANGVYRGRPSDCYSCHKADYQRSQEPNHAAAGYPTACESCHRSTDASFKGGASFNHNAAFALYGAHATQPCSACHKNNVYRGTPRDCYRCHQADYQRAQSPNHVAAGFSTACESCHRPNAPSFKGAATFNHNAAYQLVGVHTTLDCAACHRTGVYKGTPRDCYSCHQANYAATKNPNHAAAGFGTTCDSCHKPTDPDWSLATSTTHASFALVGLHATQPCAACHRNGVFKGTPRDCFSCHQANYAATANPNHAAAGYPTTCDACHKPTDPSWLLANATHTSFGLVGVHATQPCSACHRNNVYKGTPRDCFACHQANYAATSNPNHAAAGYPTTCDSCHKPTDPTWLLANTTHTSFALVGVHATQPCSACHKNNVYKGTPRDCFACHQANYAATTNPNHAAAGYPTTCDSCHKATDPNWLSASTSHTTFPLVGVHATQACAACHKNGIYRGTPRDCYSCHQARFAATTNPNHAAAGFPTTCDSCHKPTDPTWLLATYAHGTYALVGVHATQPCSACHKSNVYKGTPRDCYACHQVNYAQTTNPNHAGAGFPTTCDTCHKATDATWLLATFNHTWFPTTGRHSATCATCHTDPTNYKVFSCLTCHDRASTDSHHSGRAGYRYDSNACYSCHPRGTAD